MTLSLDVQGVGAQGPAGADGSGGKMEMKKMPDHSGMKMWTEGCSAADCAGPPPGYAGRYPDGLPEEAGAAGRF